MRSGPIVGYSWIVLAAVGTGFLSFGLWVHHMFATGLPQISLAFFSAASEAVAIPTGVQIFVFIATMLAGRVIFSVPMLFGAGGIAIFVIGGLTGVMVALVPFDWQAHDTYFIVAHLHYVLIGGMLFPLIAGIYYYYPLINARMLSMRLGRIAFWLMFVGFNIAFFPMHLTGLRGMPRRVFTYPEGIGWDWLNLVSTVGAFILAAGVLVVVVDVVRPKHRQPRGEQNPWNAGTLEWLNEPEENWGVRSIPGDRKPLSTLGPEGPSREGERRCLLPRRRERKPPRDADHLGARRAAHAMPAGGGTNHDYHHLGWAARWCVCRPDLRILDPRFSFRHRHAGRYPVVALDRHR